MIHILTRTTPYLRHLTSLTPDSSTHIPSHMIRLKAELATLKAHNICTNRPLNSIATLAAWKNLQPMVLREYKK